MAFLQSIILGSTSFLLGLIFVCQIIDIPLLYHPHILPSSLESAYHFYTLWYDAPKAVKALLHSALGLPLLAIVGKLHGWSESAVFFDGSSLVLHMAVIIIYLTIHVPNIPIFVNSPTLNRLREHTPDEKSEAVRVLSAGNALIGLCLIGIISMQAGQEYAKRQEEAEQRRIDARIGKVGGMVDLDAAGGAATATASGTGATAGNGTGKEGKKDL